MLLYAIVARNEGAISLNKAWFLSIVARDISDFLFLCKSIYSQAFRPVIFIQYCVISDVRRMFIWASLMRIVILHSFTYIYLLNGTHLHFYVNTSSIEFYISSKSLTKKMYNGLEIEWTQPRHLLVVQWAFEIT